MGEQIFSQRPVVKWEWILADSRSQEEIISDANLHLDEGAELRQEHEEWEYAKALHEDGLLYQDARTPEEIALDANVQFGDFWQGEEIEYGHPGPVVSSWAEVAHFLWVWKAMDEWTRQNLAKQAEEWVKKNRARRQTP